MAKDKKKEVSKNTAKELREKLSAQLENDLKTAKKDLLELQKSLKANELANPHAVKKVRREIARIKTVLTEKCKEEAFAEKKGKEQDDLVLSETKLGSADRPMRKTVGLSHKRSEKKGAK